MLVVYMTWLTVCHKPWQKRHSLFLYGQYFSQDNIIMYDCMVFLKKLSTYALQFLLMDI